LAFFSNTFTTNKKKRAQTCLRGDLAKVAEAHAAVDAAMTVAEKAFPFEPMILSLAGYHRKNAYIAKHWNAIIGGQTPKDPLLEDAERLFFKVLCFNPWIRLR